MRVNEYEFQEPVYEGFIPQERKDEIIEQLRTEIRHKDNSIPLWIVLRCVDKNNPNYDDECIFMFDWLHEQKITIVGLNGTFSERVTNYNEIVWKHKDMPDVIPVEEQYEYFEKIRQGDQKAKEDFFKGNMRLALWICNFSKINEFNMEKEDLQSEAMLALLSAIDRFNHKKTYTDSNGQEKHYAFSTYATKRIYGLLFRAYDLERRGRYAIPVNVLAQLDQIADVRNEAEAYGERATETEIAEILGMPKERVKELLKIENDIINQGSLEQNFEREYDDDRFIDEVPDADRIFETDSGYVLDGVYEEPRKSKEAIATSNTGFFTENSNNQNSIEDIWTLNNDLQYDIDKILSTLTQREENVLRCRFGLDGKPSQTLEETGRLFGVTRERIRQIEAKALRKLRHPSRSRRVRDYLNMDFDSAAVGIETNRPIATEISEIDEVPSGDIIEDKSFQNEDIDNTDVIDDSNFYVEADDEIEQYEGDINLEEENQEENQENGSINNSACMNQSEIQKQIGLKSQQLLEDSQAFNKLTQEFIETCQGSTAYSRERIEELNLKLKELNEQVQIKKNEIAELQKLVKEISSNDLNQSSEEQSSKNVDVLE